MEFKGTKGEWKTRFDTHSFCDTGDYQTDAIVHVGKSTICQIFQDDEEQEANAKLIAAAPELLKALQEIREEMSFWEGEMHLSVMNKANKSIEKALK